MEEDNTCRAIEKKELIGFPNQHVHVTYLECSYCQNRIYARTHDWNGQLIPGNFCSNCGRRVVGSVIREYGVERDTVPWNINGGCYGSIPLTNYCSHCGQKILADSSDDNALPTVTGSSTSVSSLGVCERSPDQYL